MMEAIGCQEKGSRLNELKLKKQASDSNDKAMPKTPLNLLEHMGIFQGKGKGNVRTVRRWDDWISNIGEREISSARRLAKERERKQQTLGLGTRTRIQAEFCRNHRGIVV